MSRVSIRPTRRHKKAAKLLAHGASYTAALTASGFSPAQARKGSALIRRSPGFQQALREEMEAFPPGVRADLVRLRLIRNLIDGEDRATASARLLGQDREISLFEPEHRQQIVLIQPPASVMEMLVRNLPPGENDLDHFPNLAPGADQEHNEPP